MKERYQLRYAIGKYWLLDMKQERFCYKPPITLNDTGCFIWREICRGSTKRQTAQALGREYGIGEAQAEEDVTAFLEQLRKQGMQVSCTADK